MADQKKTCMVARDVSAFGCLVKICVCAMAFLHRQVLDIYAFSFPSCTPSKGLSLSMHRNQSACSYRKHYIIIFFNSSLVYLGHLLGMLYN